MTVIENVTRDAVLAERTKIERELCVRYGTTDRLELREASVTGEMSSDDVMQVERLRTLDFLIHAE